MSEGYDNLDGLRVIAFLGIIAMRIKANHILFHIFT